jgi:hypothetical protein
MGLTKSAPDTLCQTCVFASSGICGLRTDFSASGERNIDALFFMLGWDWYGFHKNRTVTRYIELVFFHTFGSTGHILDFGASGPRNVDALFLMLGWARCDL